MQLPRKWTTALLTLAWMIGTSVFAAALLGPHFFAQKTKPLAGLPADSGWGVHHFLSLKCGCSKKILAHLTERKASEVPETVHLIAGDSEWTSVLEAAGYRVAALDEQEAVTKYGLEVLPQLVVLRDSEVLYQGGYARDQMHARSFEDAQIVSDLRAGKNVNAHAIFGCANGSIRKNLVDFLGVKYGKQSL